VFRLQLCLSGSSEESQASTDSEGGSSVADCVPTGIGCLHGYVQPDPTPQVCVGTCAAAVADAHDDAGWNPEEDMDNYRHMRGSFDFDLRYRILH
jgi:hypothetical protein